MLKLAAFVIVLSLALTPFVMMNMPWAVKLWRRIRLLAFAYVLIIFISALIALVTHWDELYG